jgi:hypothetical protein
LNLKIDYLKYDGARLDVCHVERRSKRENRDIRRHISTQAQIKEGGMAEGNRGKEFVILIMCLIGALIAFLIAGAVGN